jgi:hypothetical protein
MSYLPHQIEKSEEVLKRLRRYKFAMLWGAPRSGKTRTAIRVCESVDNKRILFLTKKAAIPGIEKELSAVGVRNSYKVTNYEQAKKLKPDDYDFVVLDESHNLNGTGKPKQKHKDVRALCFNKPCLLMSGTPAVENLPAIYYQVTVSRYGPFVQFKNFYEFFRAFGISNQIWIGGRAIEQYNKAKPALTNELEPYVVRMTQHDAGITLERKDVVHTVALSGDTKDLIKEIMTHGVADFYGTEYAFDSDMGVRAAVHQIESGAIVLDDKLVMLPNVEVIDYIRKTFKGSLAIMAHFKATREKLARHIPEADVFSSVSHCEGTDLSGYDHFIILNSDYSGAKFIQRLERNTRLDLNKQPIVNHIVTDGGISGKVYEALKNKEDFNLERFRRERKRYSTTNTHMVKS